MISIEGEYSQFSQEIPFEIKCIILNETMIYDVKLKPEVLSDFENITTIIFEGFYDSALKTEYIHITKNDFEKINVTIDEKQVLIMKTNKNYKYNGMNSSKHINLEATVIQEDTSIQISERILTTNKEKN